MSKTKLPENLDLNAGRFWLGLGKFFVGLNVVTGLIDILSRKLDVSPETYIATALTGIASYYIGHSERKHQTQLYIASKLEEIAENSKR